MIGAHAKYGRTTAAAKIREVIGLAIQNYPRDPRGCGSAAHMRQGCAADRLEYNRVGMLRSIPLNYVQQLLTLINGVIAGVADLYVNSETLSGGFRGSRLLDLEIIIIGYKRNQETEPFHGRHAPREKKTRSNIQRIRRPQEKELRMVFI
jgi:hypothetical protein